MTEQPHRIDIRQGDEPDGTTAYEASLRPPGHSVDPGVPADEPADLAPEDRTGEKGGGIADRSGYDSRSLAGDSPNYRPE
ncbi:hypothetical protein [Actinoplanes sp. NPDC048796]|uniref:hypothetical protein n=1 Tax=unclassified Actinoplanes TaxID=2626549 RepID=UPI0033E839F0